MTETTPRTLAYPESELARRRDLFARIRAERTRVIDFIAAEFPEEGEFLDRAEAEIDEVAIVLGSPRGGTSVFKDVLAQADGAIALPGEHRLFFTLLGLNHPDHAGMDECRESGELDDGDRAFLLRNLFYECRGTEIAEPTPKQWERHAWEWALRFRLQWPEIDVALDEVVGVVRDALVSGPVFPEPTLDVLRALIAHGLPVNPYYYDLDEELVREAFPDMSTPSGPPSGTIVEISPFLALRPRHRPGRDAASRLSALVIKASSDAYRIPLLRELFAGWKTHELHLTRNPMAAVNGLIDGWEHRSFWQHDLAPLGLPAGADGTPARTGWKFDLCEGWMDLASGPLPDLCAAQWSDPHRRIMAHAGGALRLRFEDFQAGNEQRRALMERAATACGLRVGERMTAAIERPRRVNSTIAPAPARWRRERPHLVDLCENPEVAEVSDLLGYREEQTWS